jgi:hypothetical protein
MGAALVAPVLLGVEDTMPARDSCEVQVVIALEKAGWVVTNQPYTIGLNRVEYAYADL